MYRIGIQRGKSRLVVVRDQVGREWGVMANGHEISFWSNENLLELVVMVVKLCEYTKTHWIVFFFLILKAFFLTLKNKEWAR